MPQEIKRQSTKRYNTADIMGEGSWVDVHVASLGEAKEFRKMTRDLALQVVDVEAGTPEAEALDAEAAKFTELWYGKHLVGWNWVDDDGNPLPLPGGNPEVLEKLNPIELEFLANAVLGQAVDQKKLSRR